MSTCETEDDETEHCLIENYTASTVLESSFHTKAKIKSPKQTSNHLNFKRIRTAKSLKLKWPQCSIPSDFSLYSIIQTISVSHSHSSLIFQNLTLNINLHSLYSQSQLSSLSSLNLSLFSLCSQSQVSSLNSQPLTPYPPPPWIHSFPNPSWPPPHHHSTITGLWLRLTFHHRLKPSHAQLLTNQLLSLKTLGLKYIFFLFHLSFSLF